VSGGTSADPATMMWICSLIALTPFNVAVA
jgi:hypothetical protein